MNELVVISGKGGTGKTSVVASLAALADQPVLADCDVDAADLHLVLAPRVQRRADFLGGQRARIKPGHCTTCGKCEELCRFDAIFFDGPGNGHLPRTFRVDPTACEGCGVCAHFCAQGAIEFGPAVTGQWFISETRRGPMVHARLGVAQSNSGKLVHVVRSEARRIAKEQRRAVILVDGPPGIGCPVIASITGATLVLAMTEPTLSGEHDLERVLSLARHFRIPSAVCVNKWDLNPDLTRRIEQWASYAGANSVGRIPYDPAVTAAQIQGKAVVELDHCPAAQAMIQVWKNISQTFTHSAPGPAPPTSAP